MTSLLRRAAALGPLVLYLVVAGMAFGESAVLLDLLLPGEAGMVFLGAAVEQAEGSLPAAVAACAAGAVLGDTVGFLIGRRWGWSVVRRWGWMRRRLERKVHRAERYFKDRGGLAVVAGRWVGALRAVVPVVAGTARMPLSRFLAWDVPAAVSWAVVVVSLGYVFGGRAARVVDRLDWVVALVVLVAGGAWLAVRRRRRDRRS